MRIFDDMDGDRPVQGFDTSRQALCLSVLLAVFLYAGGSSSSAAAQAIQPMSHAQHTAASVIADGRDTGLSPAIRARAGLKDRIFLKYREMTVISDDQYRITQAAIRDNRAHQTPLRTSELLFNKCMHDGRYSEAAIIASLAVLDSNTPVERAHFTLLQAEACLLRQDDVHAILPLLQQAGNELSASGAHDDSWQQASAMLEEMQAVLLSDRGSR